MEDFVVWTEEQGRRLRARDGGIDWEAIAEEIEGMGRSETSAYKSALRLICHHLLKWIHQPERRSNSWRATITTARLRVQDIEDDSPSLRARREEIFAQAYGKARRIAADETGLPVGTFPEAPPFTVAEALDEDCWPS
ncbi:MAG: DUF29 domain-containing protein [Geminicoccaceae bacterium]|nr:DUF29 domain-containing protein [Geminicoccaceae bacterium]